MIDNEFLRQNMASAARQERQRAKAYYNNKIKKIIAIAIILAVILVILSILITKAIMKPESIMISINCEYVTVKPQDSIWAICSSYCPTNLDIRDYVSIVMRFNNKTSPTIYIGETIKIPLFEEVELIYN